ncbi:hypothetical protein AQUCO_01000077v1 [Aquilegia coerulea]|uniref:GTD-binding domain-containing protein n=1 Tax=Aquilegia coerulea TaxID=218851 RepID=A0A2G5E867_AQUCA|nr:hypothetical protein AQUCO_01000077v1 [Aquilegia coerulea]
MEYASYLNFSTKTTDFGCGFLMFGSLAAFGNMLLLVFVLVLGLWFLNLGCNYSGLDKLKSIESRNGFCSGICYSKISSCRINLLKLLNNSVSDSINSKKSKEVYCLSKNKFDVNESLRELNEEEDDDGNEEEEEKEKEEVGDDYKEEEEMDLMALRKVVRIERKRANDAYIELEKERTAAGSAANEALAMILRLQNELSSSQMQFNQYQRLAEQKQLHDQEVIHCLRWIVLKHESERSFLESQLNLCRQKFKLCAKADDEDGLDGEDWTPKNHSPSPSFGDDLTEDLVSSLDMDSELR